jgi:hypothetical protein
MPNPFESLRLGNQLCFAIYAADHAFTAAYKPLLDPLGLTPILSTSCCSCCGKRRA